MQSLNPWWCSALRLQHTSRPPTTALAFGTTRTASKWPRTPRWDPCENIYTSPHDWIYPIHTAGLTNPSLEFNVHPIRDQSCAKECSRDGDADTQDRSSIGTLRAEELPGSKGSTEWITDCDNYSAGLYQDHYCHLYMIWIILWLKFSLLAVNNQHSTRKTEFCSSQKGLNFLKYDKISFLLHGIQSLYPSRHHHLYPENISLWWLLDIRWSHKQTAEEP